MDTPFEVKTVADVDRIIDEHLPGGLEAYRKDNFLSKGDGGAYIGFNLNRFAYTSRLAAECHAMRDLLNGVIGHSYGCPFKPHVTDHGDWFEVVTN